MRSEKKNCDYCFTDLLCRCGQLVGCSQMVHPASEGQVLKAEITKSSQLMYRLEDFDSSNSLNPLSVFISGSARCRPLQRSNEEYLMVRLVAQLK